MKKPLVSIIIATYNSSKVLPKVLRSVRAQTYPKSRVEILIVDGGSTDKTRTIARSYGCRIIHNSKILPLWAKYTGYKKARGHYAMFLDSDEVIENPTSIERKIAVLRGNPTVHAVSGSGYKNPDHLPFINRYINEFGDPFSFFYYRSSKDERFFINSMTGRYKVLKNTRGYLIFDLSAESQLPLFELSAMGGLVDLHYLKKFAPEIASDASLIAHIINVLVSKGTGVAILRDDPLIHYSADTYTKYMGKIVSRVVNNIFTPAKEGFTGRSALAPGVIRVKKYLFLPYAFTLVGPFADAVYLCLTRKHIGYLMHVPLTIVTACIILYYSVCKVLGVRIKIKSYGEAMPVR